MYTKLGISDALVKLGNEIEAGLKDRFAEIDETAEYNQLKVLYAMQKNHLQEAHFAPTTGYGYTTYVSYRPSSTTANSHSSTTG